MALQSDEQGFLIGPVVAGITRATDALMAMRSDIRAIRTAILSTNSGTTRSSRSSSGDSNPRPQQVVTVATPNRTSASSRDVSGRFVGSSSAVTPRGRDSNQAEPKQQATLINGMARRIGSAISAGANGTQDSDPAIKSLMEVAEPMKRGYAAFFGGGDKKERWFRRIFGELKLFRRDSSVFDRAQSRSLHNIENNPGGAGSDGNSSFLGGAIGALFGRIAPLALTAIAGIGSVLLTGISTVLGVIFSPIGLAIGAAATLAWGIFTDDGHKFFADIGNKISAGWTKVTDWFIKSSPKTMELVNKGVKTVNKSIDAVKTGTGNITESVKKSSPKTTEAISKTWNNAKQYLASASENAGVDAGIVAKIANFESGFNSNATPTRKDGSKISTAHGYGQFLDGTWTEMINKYGSKYGVDGAGALTKSQAAKYRNDKSVQAGMLAEFTRENVAKGRELGGSNDDANVYALHNLGSGTGPEFLKALRNNPNAPVNSVKGMSDKVIAGNKSLYGDGDITIADAYGRMGKAMDRGSAYALDIRGKTQSAHMPMPTSPKIPTAPPIQDSPGVVVPMGSGGEQKPLMVSLQQGDVPRDLPRPIGHIVSGGLSGNY